MYDEAGNYVGKYSFLTQPKVMPDYMNTMGSWGGSNIPAMVAVNTADIPMPNISTASPGFMGGFKDWMKSSGMLSSVDTKTGMKTDGWGGLALGAAQALSQAYMGMKQYGLAKDQFNFQRDAWNKEYEINKNLTNSRLEDRQRRRVAENPGLAQDTASYMAKYGVK